MADALRDAMAARTAQEWEEFLIEINVPGARMRDLLETLGLEHVRQRGFLHRYDAVPGVERPVTVPVAAFRYAEGGPHVDTPPPRLGADTDGSFSMSIAGADSIDLCYTHTGLGPSQSIVSSCGKLERGK